VTKFCRTYGILLRVKNSTFSAQSFILRKLLIDRNSQTFSVSFCCTCRTPVKRFGGDFSFPFRQLCSSETITSTLPTWRAVSRRTTLPTAPTATTVEERYRTCWRCKNDLIFKVTAHNRISLPSWCIYSQHCVVLVTSNDNNALVLVQERCVRVGV
jgi:hypothetical protein